MFIVKQSHAVLALLLMALVAVNVSAKEAVPLAANPKVEKKVNDITSELRCLVCQNQTIAESHADLAIDLKNQVRGMVASGETRDQIVDYMVKRYGDFVRYRPAFKPKTYLLWGGPFLLLLLGLTVLFITVKRRKVAIQDAPLSEQESAQLDNLLHSKADDASGKKNDASGGEDKKS